MKREIHEETLCVGRAPMSIGDIYLNQDLIMSMDSEALYTLLTMRIAQDGGSSKASSTPSGYYAEVSISINAEALKDMSNAEIRRILR